jgi:DNA-directed RNA polymerase subunit F
LDRASGWLTNYKLYQILKSDYNKFLKREHVSPNIAIIESQVLDYLEAYTIANNQNSSTINNCLNELKPYNLTQAELLQIVNLCPLSDVDIYTIVEDCELRLKQDDIQNILRIVKHNFLEAKTSQLQLTTARETETLRDKEITTSPSKVEQKLTEDNNNRDNKQETYENRHNQMEEDAKEKRTKRKRKGHLRSQRHREANKQSDLNPTASKETFAQEDNQTSNQQTLSTN